MRYKHAATAMKYALFTLILTAVLSGSTRSFAVSPSELVPLLKEGNLADAGVRECLKILGPLGYFKHGRAPNNFLTFRFKTKRQNRNWAEFINRYLISSSGPLKLLSLSFDLKSKSLKLGLQTYFFSSSRSDKATELEFSLQSSIQEDLVGTKVFKGRTADGKFRVNLWYAENSRKFGSILQIRVKEKMGWFKWQPIFNYFAEDIEAILPTTFLGSLFMKEQRSNIFALDSGELSASSEIWKSLSSRFPNFSEARRTLDEWKALDSTIQKYIDERAEKLIDQATQESVAKLVTVSIENSTLHNIKMEVFHRVYLQDATLDDPQFLEWIDSELKRNIKVRSDIYDLRF